MTRAVVTDDSPTVQPMDKSMPAVMMTYVWPIAISMIRVLVVRIVEKFRTEKKPVPVTEKKMTRPSKKR